MAVRCSDSDLTCVILYRGDPTTYTIDIRERASAELIRLIVFVFDVDSRVAFRQDASIAFDELSDVRFGGASLLIGIDDLCAPFRAGVFQRRFFRFFRDGMLICLDDVFVVNVACRQPMAVQVWLGGEDRQVFFLRLLRYNEIAYHFTFRYNYGAINDEGYEDLYSDGDVDDCEVDEDDAAFGNGGVARSIVCEEGVEGCFFYIRDFPRFRIDESLRRFSSAFQFFSAQRFRRSATRLSFRHLGIELYRAGTIGAYAWCVVEIISDDLCLFTRCFFGFAIKATNNCFIFRLLDDGWFDRFTVKDLFLVLFCGGDSGIVLADSELF